MPVVSVIIPNYNTAHYLVEAIESVYASDYKDFEIIVIDDGSKDNSAEVVVPYQSLSNFKFIAQANKGLAGARNTGIKAAKGKYLVFLDSDDIILPPKMSVQADFLDNNGTYDAVYSSSVFFKDGEADTKITTGFPNYSGNILQQLLYGNFMHVNAIMIRKDAVVRAGFFDETLRELEDWDLWLRLSLAGSNFHYQEAVLSEVRLRKGSMTSDQMKMNATMVKVLEKNIPYLKEAFPVDRKLIKHAFTALLQYILLANQKSHFNQVIVRSFTEIGVTFVPTAIKLVLKRYIGAIYTYDNKTTRRLEEVWNE